MERSSLIANARIVGPANLGRAEQLDVALAQWYVRRQIGDDRPLHVLARLVDVVLEQHNLGVHVLVLWMAFVVL